MTLVRLMLRRHRLPIGAWSVLLVAMCAVTVPAYQDTYPTAAQRHLVVAAARHDTASGLLYGRLADPGTPALMYAWEIGAFATILAAVAGVLLAVALTRATEDDGTLELVRSCGLDPASPLRAAFAVLALVAAVLAAGCAAASGLGGRGSEGVTWTGSLAFGLVVGLTFLLFGALTAVLGQLAPTAGAARVAGFAVLGAAFAARALADTRDAGWLNRLSPLALRATVRPFGGDRWWALGGAALVAVALAGLAGWLSGRREYRAGLLPPRRARDARLRIRSGAGLAARLARPPVVAWTVLVASLGMLFVAMGSGVVRRGRDGDLGGFLGAQVGTGDPVAGYLGYVSTVLGLVVAAFAVRGVLRACHDEARGLTDQVLATGTRRWRPLLWQVGVSAAGSAVILCVTGALAALVAPAVISGSDVAARAFAYPVGQWPAAMAAAGFAALLAGWRPRWGWLAWLPLVASGALALLGGLLGVPRAVQDLGLLRHVPDVAAAHPALGGLGALLAVAAAGVLLGVAGVGRRDIVAG